MKFIDDAGKVWHKSDGATFVQLAFCRQVDRVRVFSGLVGSQIQTYLMAREIGCDLSPESRLSRMRDPKHTHQRFLRGAPNVLAVNSNGRGAQVRERIVSPVAVDVVDFARWPLPSYMEPRQPMGPVRVAVNVDSHVSEGVSSAGRFTAMVLAPRDISNEFACFRAVVDHLKQSFVRQGRRVKNTSLASHAFFLSGASVCN